LAIYTSLDTIQSCRRASLRATLVQKHLETFSKALSPQEEATQAAGGPRNLYVLNLSLEMTNQELERLFSAFGSVNHVCIMAVLDSLGRRRAFVDMASGDSARQAIASLHGTLVHGYKIDVSFAIIQRSGGPVSFFLHFLFALFLFLSYFLPLQHKSIYYIPASYRFLLCIYRDYALRPSTLISPNNLNFP
jgi:RNA recognition motif-containing protein